MVLYIIDEWKIMTLRAKPLWVRCRVGRAKVRESRLQEAEPRHPEESVNGKMSSKYAR